jgi:type II secretory pathway component PulJ
LDASGDEMNSPQSACAIEQDQASGFSLIDMLVALILISLLAALMMGFLGQLRSIKRIQADMTSRAELDALAAYLEDAIAASTPLPFIKSDPEERISFTGDRTKVSFVTIARRGARSFGLRETTIELEGAGRSQKLIQTLRPRRFSTSDQAVQETSVPLAENITSLEFRYLYYEGEPRRPLWTEEWASKPGLPAAVQIDLLAVRNGRTVTASRRAIIMLAAPEF